MSEPRMGATTRTVVVATALCVLGCVSSAGTAHCVEAAPDRSGRAVAERSMDGIDLPSQFQARRRLESMGLRGLYPVGPVAPNASVGSVQTPQYRQRAVFRSRIVAPTLAFLHGLCDSKGGLPEYGTSVDFAMHAGGVIEIAVSYLGELVTAEGRPSAIWAWDPGRLPGNVHAFRVGGGAAPR